MSRIKRISLTSIAVPLLLFACLDSVCVAQTVKIRGMIKLRSGPTMVVQTTDGPVDVLLSDKTEVGQIEGVLKARRKEMSMAALIPGLEVQAEGTYNDQRQLLATLGKFQGNDLERAQSIQAGMHQTEAQAARNKEELEKQQEKLAAGRAAIEANQAAIAANQASIAASQAKIDAAVARFGQLDDYYIFDEVTVLFGNGKVDLEAQYKPQLRQLAEKAKTIEAYMIQVVGYASSSGSAALNQKLSEERAASVTQYLTQDCDVGLMNMLAPGAMGESRQVGDEKSEEGQAQSRRVVVRVLQNKGIAGHKEAR